MSTTTGFLREVFRYLVSGLILMAGVLGFIVLQGMRTTPETKAPADSTPLVTTAAITEYPKSLVIRVTGEVTPHSEIKLATEVTGRVEYKSDLCAAGNFVTGGQELCRIDPTDYDLQKAILEAEVQQAQDAIDELNVEIDGAKALLALAADDVELQQTEFDRKSRLSRVLSASDIDAARRSLLASQNAERNMRNQFTMSTKKLSRMQTAKLLAERRLEQAKNDLARTTIRVPDGFEGMIVDEHVEQNDYVQKGAALVTLEDTSSVDVKVNLRMDELNWLLRQRPEGPMTSQQSYQIPKTPVTVYYELDGYRFSWEGELSRYDGIGLDAKTRTVPCLVEVQNPTAVKAAADATGRAESVGPRALVRGMYVTVEIHVSPGATLLQAPESAIRPGDRLLLVRDNQLFERPIVVAGAEDGIAIIDPAGADVSVGDKVVVSPMPGAAENSLDPNLMWTGVKVREAGETPTEAADESAD